MNAVFRPYLHPRLPPRFTPALFQEASVLVGAATCQMSLDAQAAGVTVASGSSAIAAQVFASQGDLVFDGVALANVSVIATASPVIVGSNENTISLVSAAIEAEGQGGAVVPQQANVHVTVGLQATGTRIVPGESAGAASLDARRFVERWIDNRPDYRFGTRQFFQRRR